MQYLVIIEQGPTSFGAYCLSDRIVRRATGRHADVGMPIPRRRAVARVWTAAQRS